MRPDSGMPVVVIPGEVQEIDGFTMHTVLASYLDAIVHGCGGTPLMLPPMGDAIDFDDLLRRVDGVLLPGSLSNVHPSLYGAEPSEKTEPHDPRRDALTLPLIRATLRHGVPLFAICRGTQELNVALGGTLVAEVHELEGRSDHRAPAHDDLDVRYGIRQDVHIKPGGTLETILGAGPVAVNSLHRQAIDRLAEELAIEATAPDGTIEAVRVRNAASFALGVQWHPEYWVRTDAVSQRLFAAFGSAMRDRPARRGATLSAAE
jgi:putative glutamine amidotransferase